MAVLALGLVGSAIGASIGGTFLGVAAASWGFVGGQILGGMLFAPHQHAEGSRIGDLSVQVSTYGTMVPIIYGTMRVTGNVIFCTDKREVKTDQSSGGKGGPKVTTTTYSYNVDMAVALCEGPIVGIRKVWANGKLIYDASENASVESTIQSSLHAQGFKVYLGDEAQLPDPTIEVTVGAGSTPAYRGVAYVVFDHLDCPNGQIPQLSFEVVTAGSVGQGGSRFSLGPAAISGTTASMLKDKGYQFNAVVGSSPVTIIGPGWTSPNGSRDFTVAGAYTQFDPVPVQGGAYAMTYTLGADNTYPESIVAFDLRDGAMRSLLSYVPHTSDHILWVEHAAYDSVSDRFCAISSAVDSSVWQDKVTVMPSGVVTPSLTVARVPLAFYDSVIYCCGTHSGVTCLDSYDADTGALLDRIHAASSLGSPAEFFVHADENGVYVLDNPSAAFAVNRRVWKVGSSWALLTSAANFENLDNRVRTFYANDRYAIVGPGSVTTTSGEYRIINFTAVATSDVAVGDVIEDLCLRAGVAPGQADASDVTQTLHGYAINRVSSARASIDPLMRAYFLDACESGAALLFTRRAAKTAVASIPFNDLGCTDPGEQAADPLPLTRIQEAELPRSIAITYVNYDADYQPGTETARRQVTASVYDATDELPIATTPDHIATVAATLLYDAWLSRTQRKSTIPRTYAWLDVADLVSVEYPQGTWSTKRLTKATDTGARLEVEMVDADAGTYALAIAGATPAAGQAGVEYVGPTRLELLDIPLLRDRDDDAGFYAAANGYASSWSGASIFRVDSTGNTLLAASDTAAVIGTGTTVLAAPSGLMVDEFHTVDVLLAATVSLSSVTRDAMLDDRTVNAAVLGDEIIQFATATSLGSGAWRLARLRRGLRGTEWACGTHEIGERFVLLQTTGMRRLPMEIAERDVALGYQAITTGAQSADVTQSFANDCAGLKPLAPGNLDVAADSTGVQVRWVRRSRYADNWLAGSVPLAETTEAYSIDVTPPGAATLTFSATASPAVLQAAAYVAAGDSGMGGATSVVSQGGFIYALGQGGVLKKCSASDLSVIGGVLPAGTAEAAVALVGDGTYLYTVDFSGGTGKARVRKFDSGLNLLASSADFPLASDGVGNSQRLVLCAGSLWVGLVYSSLVRRINPSTLATVIDISVTAASDVATDGTYVYVRQNQSAHIAKVDPGSNTVTATFTVDQDLTFSYLACGGGHLFTQKLDGTLRVTNTADGTNASHALGKPGDAPSAADGHIAFTDDLTRTVTIADATTLAAYGSFAIPLPPGGTRFTCSASLLTRDQVVAARDNSAYVDYYNRVALGAGTRIDVYQLSSTVGRGFAATKTL